MVSEVKSKATETARRRYDRIAPFYDWMQGWMEKGRNARWRKLLWNKAAGPRILEIGVGTGKNFPYYPAGAEITAVDLSPKMLRRARDKAIGDHIQVNLSLMDAQRLAFPDDSFDSVVASYVFCSVPDPVRGLEEARRVCQPGGKVLLLEHVRSSNPLLGRLMDFLNPLVVRVLGANINRPTLTNIERSNLHIEATTNLWDDIVKLVEARKVSAAR